MSDTAQSTGTEGATPESGAPAEQTDAPEVTIESLQAEIEALKGHSRKWEDRAKANKEAADELAALKRAQMTDAEKAQADAAEIEQRVADAEDRAAKAEAALARYKVATEFGLSPEDAEALSEISDEKTLRALAERLAGRSSGPRPDPAQGRRSAQPKPGTPADAFVAALEDLF